MFPSQVFSEYSSHKFFNPSKLDNRCGSAKFFGSPYSGKFQEWGFILQIKEVWVCLYPGPPSSAKMIKSTWSLLISNILLLSHIPFGHIFPEGYGWTPCLLTLSDPAAFHFTWRKKTCGGELCPPSKVRKTTKGTTKGPFVRRRIGIYASRFFYRCRPLPFLFLDEYFFRRRERIPSSSLKQIVMNN